VGISIIDSTTGIVAVISSRDAPDTVFAGYLAGRISG
jgi:hypothetical protein